MKVILIFYLCVVFSFLVSANNPTLSYANGHNYGAIMPFSFGYAVKNEYYNDYAHDTVSNGKVRMGTYRTLLPDGRTQIVNYKADDNGYVADVQYQEEAKYNYKPGFKASYYLSPTYSAPAY